jgi:hypothetical protein
MHLIPTTSIKNSPQRHLKIRSLMVLHFRKLRNKSSPDGRIIDQSPGWAMLVVA